MVLLKHHFRRKIFFIMSDKKTSENSLRGAKIKAFIVLLVILSLAALSLHLIFSALKWTN
jgi:hypothetical protein